MRTLALLPLLVACATTIPDGADPVACTKEARASTIVTLVTEDGQEIWDAPQVTFTTPGAEARPCEAWADGRFVCGWEVAGPMTLRGDAWGWDPAEVEVDVPADECHVITQEVRLTLPTVVCPDVERWAVRVFTVDQRGQPVGGGRVEAMPLGENWTFPELCEPVGQTEFMCGLGWTGEVEIWAMERRTGNSYDVVDVPADECGPLTVDHTAVLTR